MSNKKSNYSAAIIIIGDEILSGTTQDINTIFIANKLNSHGIKLLEVRTVPDLKEHIVDAVRDLSGKYDYVFTTGGIGPTHDDITADAVAAAFNVRLEENKAARAMLENYYDDGDLNKARLKMAQIPQGAELIENPVSGAPGFIIENVYVMAGIPRIMQAMFDNIIQNLARGEPVLSNTIACDLYESQIASGLSELQNKYSEVNIGSYPQYRSGELGLSLAVRTTDVEALETVTKEIVELIDKLGGKSKAINVRTTKDDG